MREVKIMGETFEVRGLTRTELKMLSGKGYPVSRWGVDITKLGQDERSEQMFDEILERGSAPERPLELDALTPAAERDLFVAIIAETFGAADEEKNSSRSGNGTQTESG